MQHYQNKKINNKKTININRFVSFSLIISRRWISTTILIVDSNRFRLLI